MLEFDMEINAKKTKGEVKCDITVNGTQLEQLTQQNSLLI